MHVCENVTTMCAHGNACHNVGKAAYLYRRSIQKKNVMSAFGILLTVLRNIGTNAFFSLSFEVFFFCFF